MRHAKVFALSLSPAAAIRLLLSGRSGQSEILFSMTLLTKQIISKFEKHPIHSQDGKGMDAEVLVKYFNPCGTGTWLITEAEREGDDWRLFGYCHIYEWEWGYLMLSELASLRLPFGLTIERDIYTAKKYVRDFLPQDE